VDPNEFVADLNAVKFDLNQRIKLAFEQKGIPGPAAQRQIYVAAPNKANSDAPKT